MKQHSGLPTYYIGLNQSTVRPALPANAHPQFLGRSVKKIQSLGSPIETPFRYFLRLNSRGVAFEDIAVAIDKRQIIVEFEKEFKPSSVAGSNWDKAYGVFSRTFELPDDADPQKVFYRCVDGQLILEIFKEMEPQAVSSARHQPAEVQL